MSERSNYIFNFPFFLTFFFPLLEIGGSFDNRGPPERGYGKREPALQEDRDGGEKKETDEEWEVVEKVKRRGGHGDHENNRNFQQHIYAAGPERGGGFQRGGGGDGVAWRK